MFQTTARSPGTLHFEGKTDPIFDYNHPKVIELKLFTIKFIQSKKDITYWENKIGSFVLIRIRVLLRVKFPLLGTLVCGGRGLGEIC